MKPMVKNDGRVRVCQVVVHTSTEQNTVSLDNGAAELQFTMDQFLDLCDAIQGADRAGLVSTSRMDYPR